MAEKLDPRQVVSLEELLTNGKVPEEVTAVRRKLEGKRRRQTPRIPTYELRIRSSPQDRTEHTQEDLSPQKRETLE